MSPPNLRAIMNAVSLAALYCLGPAAHASQWLSSPKLQDLASGSAQIVAATVNQISSAPLEGAPFAVSRVVLVDVVVAKGSPTVGPLILSMFGGEHNGLVYGRAGQPILRKGERYVLFLRAGLGTGEDAYSPIIGGENGVYRVSVARNKVTYVYDYFWRPVLSVDGRGATLGAAKRKSLGQSTPRDFTSGGRGPFDSSRSGAISEHQMIAALRKLAKDGDGDQ